MNFRIVGRLRHAKTIARGRAIRELRRLRKAYGSGAWRKVKGVATIRLSDGASRTAELHWYEAHGIVAQRAQDQALPSGLMRPSTTRRRYVLCVSNDGYLASLEPRKIYVAVADADAARHELVRVVDESGEDYLYPKSYFVPLRLPRNVRQALSASI